MQQEGPQIEGALGANPALKASNLAQERRSVAVFALIMAGGTMSSRILGFLRDMIMYAFFSRTVTDAYLVAFRLPNLFRRLLGEGSLSISFIPVFIDLLKAGHTSRNEIPKEARDLINGVFTILVAVLLILVTAGTLFMEQIVAVLVGGEGYMSIPGKYELTVQMGRVMFAFIFFISLYAYFMAILNSLKKFALAAFAPTLFNIVLVISALIPQSLSNIPGIFLAWGVLVGGVIEMGILIPGLVKMGAFPKLSFRISTPATRQIFKNLLPSWIGVGILQLTAIVNVRFGSELPEGTHSWIYLADRILELPLSLFAVSMGSALLPTLSRYWSEGDRKGLIETAGHYLRLTFYLSFPAAVGCFLLARPIVEVLFFRGRFTLHDVEMTTSILQVYAFAIFTYTGVRVIVSPFYAIKYTWLPAAISAFCLIIHTVLCMILIQPYGVIGLTSATVLSSGTNFMLLILFHQIIIGPFEFTKFFKSILKFALASAGMGLILLAYDPIRVFFASFFFSQDLTNDPATWDLKSAAAVVSSAGSLGFVIVLGALSYFYLSNALKITEAQEAFGTIFQKIQRRLNKK